MLSQFRNNAEVKRILEDRIINPVDRFSGTSKTNLFWKTKELNQLFSDFTKNRSLFKSPKKLNL